MKRVYSMLAAGALLAMGLAYAETRTAMKADVPFSFRVGKTLMPAGEYEVVEGLGPGTILVRGTDSKNAAIVFANGKLTGREPEHGSLVFNRYGDRYFLSTIWKAGVRTGFELPRSQAEREMARAAGGIQMASVRIPVR